jgi:methionyl-tRNA formyltransferase
VTGAGTRVYDVVCYVARAHGLAGVQAVLESDRYRLAGIITHRRLPKAEDAGRAERAEFSDYARLAEQQSIPLLAVDSEAEQARAIERLAEVSFDAIASISWRRLLSPVQLAQAKFGGVNLHRGALPKYAGAEPVLRALRDGAREVEICAHVLTERIDEGPVLVQARHLVTTMDGEPLEARVDRIKREIAPLFGPLLIAALDALVVAHAR